MYNHTKLDEKTNQQVMSIIDGGCEVTDAVGTYNYRPRTLSGRDLLIKGSTTQTLKSPTRTVKSPSEDRSPDSCLKKSSVPRTKIPITGQRKRKNNVNKGRYGSSFKIPRTELHKIFCSTLRCCISCIPLSSSPLLSLTLSFAMTCFLGI